jgi:hypothetical protein
VRLASRSGGHYVYPNDIEPQSPPMRVEGLKPSGYLASQIAPKRVEQFLGWGTTVHHLLNLQTKAH